MSLKSIIQTLSDTEAKAFRAFLRRKNKRSSVKNITLFDMLYHGETDDHIDRILYGKSNRNAYHALSKRVHDSLIDFIASRSFETEASDEMEVFKLLLASRIFYEKEHFKPARKTLNKARTKAQKIDLYAALNEIYHTQIQYAHLHPEEDLEPLIARFEDNQALLQQQERLNIAYATLKTTLQEPQVDMQKTLLATFSLHGITINTSLTFKSLYKLLEIINTAAHLISDFATALPFITQLEHTANLKISDGKHLYYRINYLYLMANAYFRNREFGKALRYMEQMERGMQEERGRYEERFRESALLLNSLIANYTGDASKAIASVQSHFDSLSKKKAQNPDLVLALAVFYIQQERCKQALSTVNILKHSDTWYLEKAGEDWLLKRDLVELIIHIELEHIDLVDSLFKRLHRKYKMRILQEGRLKVFLKAARVIHHKDGFRSGENFGESIINYPLKDTDDIFMLSFYAWMLSRIKAQPLYKNTLSLL